MNEEQDEKQTLPLKGNFQQDASFPRLLAFLNESGRTGTLTVTSGAIAKKVYMKDGEAVFASSNSNDDWLGVALVKAGKISLQQFDYSTEIMKKSGKRHGAVLVELGYITPKELFWAVKYQVREIIYSLFEYDRAEYEFVESQIPDEVITLKMSTGSLIYEGVSRIDNLIRIKEEIPPVWTTLQLNDDPLRLFQNVQFSPKDKKILSLVDGQRTIKQVIEDSWFNSFEAMKIVYVFWAIGILTEKKMETENITLDVLLHEPLPGEGRDAFASKVVAFHSKLPGMDPYELLGLDAGATTQETKKNYYRLAREFHPERVFDSDEQQLKEKLVDIFDAVKGAYIALMRQHAQDEAGAATSTAPEIKSENDPVEAGLPVNNIEAAGNNIEAYEYTEAAENNIGPREDAPQKADAAQSSGEAPGLIGSLREATRSDPLNPEHWRRLALALSSGYGDFFEEAERAMFEALGLSPLEGDCYAELGYIYLKAGRSGEAKRQFEKALVLDPENQKALEGLRHF